MTAYLLERAWLGGSLPRRRPGRGRGRTLHLGDARRRPAARDPGARPRRARPRQHPQPRLPPRAARPHPARARHLLDLARPDVRRRRAARPRDLPRPRAGDVPRDGGRRDHLRRGVPLPPPPARRHALRRPRTRWGWRWSGGAARPASGSPCSTPSTSPPASAPRPRARRCATATGRWRRWIDAGRRVSSVDPPRDGSAPPSTRCAPCPAADLDAVAGWVGDRPFHVHLSEQVAENDGCLEAYGVTPARLLADHGLLGRRRRSSTPPT